MLLTIDEAIADLRSRLTQPRIGIIEIDFAAESCASTVCGHLRRLHDLGLMPIGCIAVTHTFHDALELLEQVAEELRHENASAMPVSVQ
jgi:hypothetical protein